MLLEVGLYCYKLPSFHCCKSNVSPRFWVVMFHCLLLLGIFYFLFDFFSDLLVFRSMLFSLHVFVFFFYSFIFSPMKVKVSQSDSLQPHGLCSPWNSPDCKEIRLQEGLCTGVGSLSLLQGIFPTQESNPGLPHRRRLLYQLSAVDIYSYSIVVVNDAWNDFNSLWFTKAWYVTQDVAYPGECSVCTLRRKCNLLF